MRFYLETNAIYSVSKFLPADKKISHALCYSSFLTVFELLSGIKPVQYNKRRAALLKLLESGIKIDWTTPREILTKAFSVAGITDSLGNVVQKIADVVCKCSDYTEAESTCNKMSLPWGLEDIVGADKFMSLHDQKDRQKMTEKFKQDCSKKTIAELRDMVFQKKDGKLLIDSHFQKKNEEDILRMQTEFITRNLPGPNTDIKYASVMQSYDGSLKWYLGAAAYIQAKDLICGGTPAADDFFDMSHFLYVRDDHDVMVSDDKLMEEICNALWPAQHVTVKKLKEICNWTK